MAKMSKTKAMPKADNGKGFKKVDPKSGKPKGKPMMPAFMKKGMK